MYIHTAVVYTHIHRPVLYYLKLLQEIGIPAPHITESTTTNPLFE